MYVLLQVTTILGVAVHRQLPAAAAAAAPEPIDILDVFRRPQASGSVLVFAKNTRSKSKEVTYSLMYVTA